MSLADQLPDRPLTDDLRVFANQDEEKSLILCAVDRLVNLQLCDVEEAQQSLRNLAEGTNFYGTFFELATYGWMFRHSLHFEPQAGRNFERKPKYT
jgi:hypothetical protein